MQILTECIGGLVGVRSEVYRNLVRAAASDNPLDLHLAQLAFDALDPALRRTIRDRVRGLAAEKAKVADDPA